MQISKAQRTGTKTCGRCGGSGEYGVGGSQINGQMSPGVCYRCGGSGVESSGFVGLDVSVSVDRARMGANGRRRGTIDVVATITASRPSARRGHGCAAVAIEIVSTRLVGRMQDGTTFDKTIAGGLSTELHQRMMRGLGAGDTTVSDPLDVAAILADLGIDAESAA